MIILKRTKNPQDDEINFDYVESVEFNIDNDICLTDLLEEMERFIRAIGYYPKGTLDFVEEE